MPEEVWTKIPAKLENQWDQFGPINSIKLKLLIKLSSNWNGKILKHQTPKLNSWLKPSMG